MSKTKTNIETGLVVGVPRKNKTQEHFSSILVDGDGAEPDGAVRSGERLSVRRGYLGTTRRLVPRRHRSSQVRSTERERGRGGGRTKARDRETERDGSRKTQIR